MFGRRKQQPAEELWAQWSRELSLGVAELRTARPDQVVARVDQEGVLLVACDVFVAWKDLGLADGDDPLSSMPGSLALAVSRDRWAEHLASLSARERERAERGVAEGWVSVPVKSRRPVPVEAFAEWLEAELSTRAPLPDRFCLTPSPDTSVLDRDSSRRIPLDRLPISHTLRDRLAAWGAAAGRVPDKERVRESTWEPFALEGRVLAADLEAETGRSAAVWQDCPEMP